MINYAKFRISLAREQHQTCLHPNPSLLEIIQEAVTDLLNEPLDRWLDYARHHIGTSYDNRAKAEDRLRVVGDFIVDAFAVYETMTS